MRKTRAAVLSDTPWFFLLVAALVLASPASGQVTGASNFSFGPITQFPGQVSGPTVGVNIAQPLGIPTQSTIEIQGHLTGQSGVAAGLPPGGSSSAIAATLTAGSNIGNVGVFSIEWFCPGAPNTSNCTTGSTSVDVPFDITVSIAPTNSAFVSLKLTSTSSPGSTTFQSTANITASGTVTLTSTYSLSLTSVTPTCVAAGSPGLAVTISGSGFVNGAVAQWNGSPRPTSYVGGGTLKAQLVATDFTTIGTGIITVANPSGGAASNGMPLNVARSCTDSPATSPPVIQTPSSQSVNSGQSPASTVAPTCGNNSAQRGVWFNFTPPAKGTLTLDTSGSSYQTILAAYTGPPGALTSLACNAAATTAPARKGMRPHAAGAKVGIGVNKATSYYFLVTAANGDGGQLQFNVSYASDTTLPNSNRLTYLPHLITGGGFVSKLTVVNMSGAPNNIALNFVAQDGTLQTSNTLLMQPGQTVRIANPESTRSLPSSTEWSAIGSDGAVAINEFFELTGGSITSVLNAIGFNDAATVSSFTIPVEFEPPATSTAVGRTVGIALANPNSTATTVQLTLRDQLGNTLGTLPVSLAAYGQSAIDLSQSSLGKLLPTSNFVGSVSGAASSQFSLIALGDDKGPFFATPTLVGATSQVVPYIVSGQDYVTKLTYVNLASGSNTVTATYYDQSGNQLKQSNFTLPPNGARREATDESQRFASPQTVSWAVVTSSLPLGVNLFFEVIATPGGPVVNTIGFNAPPELSTFTIPAEFEPTPAGAPIGRTMGLAIANRNSGGANITLTLLDNQGSTVAKHTLTLSPKAQVALDLRTVTEFAAALPKANFVGTVVVTSDQPVAAIALEDDYGPFSAVPVINGRP